MIVIIVVAAVRRDNFRSMVLRDEMLNGDRPTEEPSRLIPPAELELPAESDVPAEPVPDAGAVDSLTVEVTDSI